MRPEHERPCRVCGAQAGESCRDEETGETLPHAIHIGRVALAPAVRRLPDGTFELIDRADEA